MRTDPPPLRYLDAAAVRAAMPSLADRLALAEVTMRGLVEGGELPPKIGVHPRPEGSFAHAMPALLRGDAADGSADRLGMKWVLGFGGNAALGLPNIHGLILLNDPRTGVPIAILDAGPVTAERTAMTVGLTTFAARRSTTSRSSSPPQRRQPDSRWAATSAPS